MVAGQSSASALQSQKLAKTGLRLIKNILLEIAVVKNQKLPFSFRNAPADYASAQFLPDQEHPRAG